MYRSALILFALTLPAAAQEPKGDKGTVELVTLCRGSLPDSTGKDSNPFASAQCLRYIQGFKDGLASIKGDPKFCAPGVKLGDQITAFLKWAEKAPLDQTRELTLIKFLSETYPCKK
jgi:hypothetical protein